MTRGRPRKNPPRERVQDKPGKPYPKFEEGFARKTVQFLRDITPPTLTDAHDVETMRKRFEFYLQKCEEYGNMPSNLAAYLACGVTKQQVWRWTKGEDQGDVERKRFWLQVLSYLSSMREQIMLNGKVHPAIGIFWQKNFDELRDEQVQVVESPNLIGSAESAEKIAERYEQSRLIETPKKIGSPILQDQDRREIETEQSFEDLES